jgi:tetratricopeptide (TPR) repeat protein
MIDLLAIRRIDLPAIRRLDRHELLIVRRSLLVVAAAVLVWRIGSVGISTYYAERLKAGDESAARKALAWNPQQPDALYSRALELIEEDPEQAASLLTRAYAENPSNVRPLILMADLARSHGDPQAEQLIDTAARFAPADPWVQARVADYWASRGNLDKALRHWSIALEADPGTKAQLFPILLNVTENPGLRGFFRPLAQSPPPWWNAFFAEVARSAEDVDSLRVLYALRREAPRAPVTPQERQTYVARLKKEGHIDEAYVHWLNGLSSQQRAQLGLLYDGGFELPFQNDGFGWDIRSSPKALVRRGSTDDIDGDAALHIVFSEFDGRFNGVSQDMFLNSSAYRVTGLGRTDGLDTQDGIKWLVRCLQSKTTELGESERFLGSSKWEEFSFEFEVPEDCGLQQIRLVSVGEGNVGRRVTGSLWFDRLVIRQIPELTRATNTALRNAEIPAAIASESDPESGKPESPEEAD